MAAGSAVILTHIECDGLDILLSYLAVFKKGRMLDVGCGAGEVLKMVEECGWKAEGVDFGPEAAAKRVPKRT